MKTNLLFLALTALLLAAGTVYADDLPYMTGKDIGALLQDEHFGMRAGEALCVKDFGAAGPPSAKIDAQEIGVFAYNDVRTEPAMIARNATGSAAGGVCPETVFKDDAKTVIWDNLVGTPGGSDLP